MGQNITSEQLAYGAEANLQAQRFKPAGWMARGPRFDVLYSAQSLSIDAHINIYQSHLHQGFWFQFDWSKSEFSGEISSNNIYLNESGAASSITQGDVITSNRDTQTSHIYWYESLKEEGPINTAGLFYTQEATPAKSTLSNTNANIFDGYFSGFGFTIGRIKDDKGLNFQWRLTLAQLDSGFSNRVTNHRALSSLESTVYKFGIQLHWHYRYYLSPYWYVVPSTHLQYNILMQTQLNPEFVEHDALGYLQYSMGVSLRRYF
ncbi:hypothetical protein NBRC116188_10650 [Oceaniserpentilla sp. 4NH20-0058]